MKRLAGLALFLTLAAPALGQGTEFQQLLSGKEFPHNLKLKELNSEWQRLSISTTDAAKGGTGDMMSQLMQAGMMSDGSKGKGKDDAAGAMLGMSLLGGLFGGGGGSPEPVYYTKGQTATVGGETFLLAYRYQKPAVNLMQLAMTSEQSGKDPDFSKMAAEGKLSPDSSLALSLINVKAITTLNNIRPFDMDREIAEGSSGSGGLMEMLAQKQAEDAKQKPAPSTTTGAPRKTVIKPASHP